MKYQLLEPHHIDEMVLPAGTIIGDGTQWPFRSTYDDKKIDRKIGDPLPPSRAMTPMDDEARALFDKEYHGEVPEVDPTRSIPLTGAPESPVVRGAGVKPTPEAPKPINLAPKDDALKTGLGLEKKV